MAIDTDLDANLYTDLFKDNHNHNHMDMDIDVYVDMDTDKFNRQLTKKNF